MRARDLAFAPLKNVPALHVGISVFPRTLGKNVALTASHNPACMPLALSFLQPENLIDDIHKCQAAMWLHGAADSLILLTRKSYFLRL
jgi:hypothetical protein